MTAKLSTTLPPQSHPYLSTFVDDNGQWVTVANPSDGTLPNVMGKKYKAQLTWDGSEDEIVTPPQPDPGDTFTGRDAFAKMKAAKIRPVLLSHGTAPGASLGTLRAFGIKPHDAAWQAVDIAAMQPQPAIVIFDHEAQNTAWENTADPDAMINAWNASIAEVRKLNPDIPIGVYSKPAVYGFNPDHPEWTRPIADRLATHMDVDVVVLDCYWRYPYKSDFRPRVREAVRLAAGKPVILHVSPTVQGGPDAGKPLPLDGWVATLKDGFEEGADGANIWQPGGAPVEHIDAAKAEAAK